MSSPEERTDISEISAHGRLSLVRALADNPGFAVFVARWQEKVEKDIEAKVWDPKTPDEEARILREVRLRLVTTFGPDKLLQGLIVALEGEADTEKKKRGG